MKRNLAEAYLACAGALHRILRGDAEAKYRESHMEEILHIMQQDNQGLLPKLLDLPCVKKRGALATAAALLAKVPSAGLSEGDAAWVKIVNISMKENWSADETSDLVGLMAAKGHAEYLARHFDHLHMSELLTGLDTSMVSSIYQALKFQGMITRSSKRRRVVGEAEKQNLVSVAAALMKKLESLYASGDRRAAAIPLRDLYTDQLEIGKLSHLILSDYQDLDLPAFADGMDLSIGEKLVETIAQGLERTPGSPLLLRSVSEFAAKIGTQYQAQGDLEKAAKNLRLASSWNGGSRSRSQLTEVLLARHSKSDGEEDKAELLHLLAEEGRWTILVEKWAALQGTAEKTQAWDTDKVDQLATEFARVGDRQMAASLHANQGIIKEAVGLKQEAFAAFRKAYHLGDKNKIGEAGIARLAVEVGRVQDAATDFLSPLLGDETRERVQTCFKLIQDYIDYKLTSSGRTPSAGIEAGTGCTGSPTHSPGPTLRHDSLFNFADSQDSDCIIERRSAPVLPTSVAPPSPVPPAPATPLSVAPATPLWQASNWTQKAGQLREQHPDRVPTICTPALDPHRVGIEPQIDYFKKPWKFLLKEDASGADLKRQIQKRLLESGALTHILGSASEIQPPIGNEELIGHLYERHKRDDCLHLKFTVDKYASGGLRLELFRA